MLDEQFNFNEVVQQLMSMAALFIMAGIAMSSPKLSKSPESPSAIKPVNKFMPAKIDMPTKPTIVPVSKPAQPIQEPTECLFKPDLTPELKGWAVSFPRPGWGGAGLAN